MISGIVIFDLFEGIIFFLWFIWFPLPHQWLKIWIITTSFSHHHHLWNWFTFLQVSACSTFVGCICLIQISLNSSVTVLDRTIFIFCNHKQWNLNHILLLWPSSTTHLLCIFRWTTPGCLTNSQQYLRLIKWVSTLESVSFFSVALYFSITKATLFHHKPVYLHDVFQVMQQHQVLHLDLQSFFFALLDWFTFFCIWIDISIM